jgi:hypothetical protein
MTDTAQPVTAAETVVASDPIADAANAFKTFDRNAPETPERPRGPDGKFVSAQPEPEIEAEDEAPQAEAEAESHDEPEIDEEAAEEAQPDVELPPSWPSDMAEDWQSLPATVREKIVAREAERETAVNAKFQEAANLRKANEAEINEAKTNRQRFAEAADFLLSVVQPQRPPTSMLDPSSSDYNPDAYHLANRKFEEQAGLLNAVAQQRAQLAQQEQAEAEKAKEQRVSEINSKHMPELSKLVPDFSDPAKADTAFHGLARYALEQGVPEDTELSAFTAVELKLLAKAQKYDEMMAAKAKVQPKAPRPAAPVVKPGVTTPRATVEAQRRKQAFERLDKSGSIEDAAAFFLTQNRK